MRNHRQRLAAHIVCRRAATLSLLIVMTNAAVAQQGGTPMGPPPGGPDLKAATRQREIRESVLRTMDMGPAAAKRDQKRIDAAIEQVKQDFKQIQIIRNEMVRDLIANKPLDYKLISDKVGEINKRADRLKAYLMPPASDDKEKSQKSQVEFNSEDMKGALVQLCNRIAIFIDNPVLKTPGINDVEQSGKAGGDLLSIIHLSSNIKRSAEKLGKASK